MSWLGRSPRASFGAIVDDFLEYELPKGKTTLVFGSRGAQAYCFSSERAFLDKITSGHRLFPEFVGQVRREVQELRGRGVTGDIPVCVYRGSETERAQRKGEAGRRATVRHERFHAALRRVEARRGLSPGAFGRAISARMVEEFGTPASDAIKLAIWGRWHQGDLNQVVNEVLAQTSSLLEDCRTRSNDCVQAREQLMEWVRDYNWESEKPPIPVDTMERLASLILQKYGDPLSFYEAALVELSG